MRLLLASILVFAARPAGAQVRNDTLRLFTVHTPPEIARTDTILGQRPDWGAQPPDGGLTARLVLTRDANLDVYACEPIVNTAEIAGQIAFIRRGVCEFPLKAWHAQQAGAIAFVVFQWHQGVPPECSPEILMGPGTGSYPPITIPGAFLEFCDADPIVNALLDSVEVTATLAPFFVVVAADDETIDEPFGIAVEPNPANGRAAVRLRIRVPTVLRVTVIDALGREVAMLNDGLLGGGTHALSVEGPRLPPGVYLVRVRGPGAMTSRTFSVAR